jgi:hypothetical protein
MSHLVIFKSAEGKQAYHQSSSLDEAVRFLEHLRNVERVEQARLYKLTEVPVEFKTYFRAELPSSNEAPAPVEEPQEAPEEAPAADVAARRPATYRGAEVDVDEAGAGTNGRRGLLKR